MLTAVFISQKIMSGQPLEHELVDAATMTDRDGESFLRIPATVSVPNHGEENEATGPQSATNTESELAVTALQQHGGDLRFTSGGSNSSCINQNGEERLHQSTEVHYPASNAQNDRDLERDEPSGPISPVSLAAAGQEQEEGHTETEEATASNVIGQSHGLVQF